MIEESNEVKIQKELSNGLLYVHTRLNTNTSKTLEAASFLYALIELLKEKGVLSIAELDTRKREMAERLVRKFADSGVGLLFQHPEYDKFTFEHQAQVDCNSKLKKCKAVCCKFPFALSKQDVEEGVIRWEFGRPYIIAHESDGYCVHLDRRTLGCKVYEQRPVPCRGFDCKNSEKWQIWQDYDRGTINPELTEQITESNIKFYTLPKKNCE